MKNGTCNVKLRPTKGMGMGSVIGVEVGASEQWWIIALVTVGKQNDLALGVTPRADAVHTIVN